MTSAPPVQDDKAPPQLRQRMRQLNDMLEQVQEIADPKARDSTIKILDTMMAFHGAGLQKILERLADAGELGQSMLHDLSQDELVSSLLLLYALHPVDLDTRVRAALESVRPFLAKHGGNVELLGITDAGEVHLKLQGNCKGCPSSAMTLKNSIEQAIFDRAPDVAGIHVAGEGLIEEHRAAHPGPATTAAAGGNGGGHGRGDGFVPVEQLSINRTARANSLSVKGKHHESL